MVKWTPGPARCRSDEYEAEILSTDMGGDRPILMRVRDSKGFRDWRLVSLNADGRFCGPDTDSGYDLMPPTITREALAKELCDMAPMLWMDIVAHVIDAVKSGRVE